MDTIFNICTYAIFLLMVSSARAKSEVFDVTKYATSSKGEITQALTSVWKEACASTSSSKILIPKGTYKLKQVDLKGPCNAPIDVQVDGTIEAPADPTQLDGNYQWIRFSYLDFLTLSGVGTFDGLGEAAWKQNDCTKNKNCKKLSMNFGFYFLNNSIIKGITSKDSKYFHVNVFGCKNATFMDFSVTAPATSPNTDGIHIGKSSEINITSSYISTGDDCISLGDGIKHITILNVTCGPGHGISVGSLGKYPNEEPVEYITVRNCTLRNTTNGLRIKTWPGTPITYLVSNLHFEDIIMVNVSNPLIIDQEYCPWNQCNKKTASKVKINKVTFKDIKGTSATQNGVIIICSSDVPCEDVKLSDIDLTFNEIPANATCDNVEPTILNNAPICEVRQPGLNLLSSP